MAATSPSERNSPSRPGRRLRPLSDGAADSLAALALMALVMATAIFWLSSRWRSAPGAAHHQGDDGQQDADEQPGAQQADDDEEPEAAVLEVPRSVSAALDAKARRQHAADDGQQRMAGAVLVVFAVLVGHGLPPTGRSGHG